jgi:signal transduction histidine kinase/CheY-like chemotaxis protein
MSTPAEYRPLVWIADDSPGQARLTQSALGDRYEIEVFLDGSSVIERLARPTRQPDVLLLDWVMTGMNGDEVCRFLRSQPLTRELPIIIVTASRIETTDVVTGLSLGANDYVPRPFASEELRARVDNVIRAKRMREQAARERRRLDMINQLGRAFVHAGPRIGAVLEVLASSLVEALCDGCTITTAPGIVAAGTTLARHRSRTGEHLLTAFTATDPGVQGFASTNEARASLPPQYHPAIARFGMCALAVVPFPARSPVSGVVTLMRGDGGEPFEPEDIVAVETSLEYAALAFESALRFDAEQAMRRQLEQILEHLPISIIVSEPGGTITHMNQETMRLAPRMRGAHTIAGVRERIQLRTLDGNELPVETTPIERALRGEAVRGVELELIFDGDEPRFVRTSSVPIFDALGNVSAAILAIDDITEERRAQAERERAVDLQRYVLGIVSHDLRTPLQTLQMGCEGIKLTVNDTAKVLAFTDRMHSTTRRMRGIIEQLLDVVRTQMGGGIPVEPADIALDEVVTSVLAELALAYPKARFEPKLDRVRGHWDRDRLAQVIANLVGNAIQHGAKTAPVAIETELAGEQALLRVRNRTVTPLSEEQIANIFVPFRRTQRPSGGSGGLGLGLYIASEILRAHHGDIVVDSNAETTTFTVRLPLMAA